METMLLLQKCIGSSGVEEKSTDDEITLTNYIPGSLNPSLDLLSQKIIQVSFIINSIICIEISRLFSKKVQVWCKLVMFCFGENVGKCYIKGNILYLRDFIWCFIFFQTCISGNVFLCMLFWNIT